MPENNQSPKSTDDAEGRRDQRLVSQKRDAVLLKHLLEYHDANAARYTKRADQSMSPDEDGFYSQKAADHTQWHTLLEKIIPLLTNAEVTGTQNP